jgi:hypothetical protein
MIAFLTGLDPAIQAAIIAASMTATTGVAGFGVLLWRLRVEAQRAIDASRNSEMMKLKLRIYENEVVPTVERTVDAEVALASFIRLFITALKTHKSLVDAGVPAATPVARVPELIRLKASFDRETIVIVTFTERWLIIDPRVEIFRIGINAALHDVREEWGAYFDVVMRAMPVELPTGLHWSPPTFEQLVGIEAASNELIDRLGSITAYAYDFQTEMQNILVGPLFGNIVPRRQPIDPRHVVISLENEALLTRYFQEDTAWGRSTNQIEENIRAAVSSTPSTSNDT